MMSFRSPLSTFKAQSAPKNPQELRLLVEQARFELKSKLPIVELPQIDNTTIIRFALIPESGKIDTNQSNYLNADSARVTAYKINRTEGKEPIIGILAYWTSEDSFFKLLDP